MESLILRMLSFDVAVPTVHLFCERFIKEIKADARTASLAMVFIRFLSVWHPIIVNSI